MHRFHPVPITPSADADPADLIFTQLLTVVARPCDDIMGTLAPHRPRHNYNAPVQQQSYYSQQQQRQLQQQLQQQQQQQQQHAQQQQRSYQLLTQSQQHSTTTQTDWKGPTVLDPKLTLSGNFVEQKKQCQLLKEAAVKIKKNVDGMNQQRIKQAKRSLASAQHVLDLATKQLTKVSQESKLDAQICEKNRVVANTIQQQTNERIRDFRSNAEKTLHGLNFNETYEVLLILGVTTQVDLLTQQGINGDALVDMTENDMQSVFNMHTLGERRRLKKNIQNLANNRGFPKPRNGQPGALGWGVAEVLAWLNKEGLGRCARYFQQQDIDGPCLLQLTPDDLGQLGVSTVGERSTLRRKLESLKKHTYAGQFVANTTTTTTGATGSPSNSTHTMEVVLQAVLEQNRELLQRVEMADANPTVPPQCLCPILHAVMQDPVIALDGHTYDREAIATWFAKSNRSPMTNMEIEPILIPNLSVRQLIEALPGRK